MSHNHSNAHAVLGVVKMLLVTACKLIGIALLFACRIISLVFSKLAELLENVVGHGSGH